MLLREMTSTATSMSPGTTGGGAGGPKPSPVVRLFSFLVDKQSISPTVHFGGGSWTVPFAHGAPFNMDSIERAAVDHVHFSIWLFDLTLPIHDDSDRGDVQLVCLVQLNNAILSTTINSLSCNLLDRAIFSASLRTFLDTFCA